jgi:hypothetical protein
MPAHTPGPWHLDPNGYVWAYGPEFPGKFKGSTHRESVCIANLQSNPNVGWDMNLIAAAPDLLAAGKAVAAAWESGDLAEAVRALSKAIERATGK